MESTASLDLAALWQHCLHAILPQAGSPVARTWLSSTQPVGFSDDTLVLAAPHSFAREWLDDKLGATLRSELARLVGRTLYVVITVAPQAANLGTSEPAESATIDAPTASPYETPAGTAVPDTAAAPQTPPHAAPTDGVDGGLTVWPREDLVVEARQAATQEQDGAPTGITRPQGPTVWLPETTPTDDPDTQLNPKYLFEHFVIGQSNRFAHAAAVAVAEAPAKSYNPLFVYGESGLGKTHLLHAIGHYVRRLYPRLKVRYVTTEQFTNEFIEAVQRHGAATFQRRYRDVDVLLVDDIQFLERAERTQEEFFHTFNALHNAEKQIVISSDRAPKSIARLEDRLRSRFEWGLMVDVQPPELETRIAILRRKAEADHLDISPDVLESIASRVRSNIRELEGALQRVSAYASLQGRRPDLRMAEQVLKDLFPEDGEREITVDLIMRVTAEYFDWTVDELRSDSRTRSLVNARQIAMYLVREMTEMSLPQIGKQFGGRDHTTVIHAKDKIATLMKERHKTYDDVQELTARIRTAARGR